MTEKDSKIESELKKLSDTALPDPDRILAKARYEMRKEKSEKKSAASAGRFLLVAGVAAAFVLLIVLASNVFSSLFRKSDGSDGTTTPVAPAQTTYAASELMGRSVSYDEAASVFAQAMGALVAFPAVKPDALGDDAQLVSVKFYVFEHIVSGKDVLIECIARVKSEQYGYDELTLFFELSDATFAGNKAYLQLPVRDGLGTDNAYEGGEYVSRAYIVDTYRCMLSVLNANTYRLGFYLEQLFGRSV